MTKAERINDMMLFLNDKKSFQLKDLMAKYQISKSTALRDIETLERMGMPIFSQRGRNGHYGILHNRLLSPIIFTMDEVLALYFSMSTLKAYQTTPFHLSVDKLKEKFENCLSKERIEHLRRIEEVLQFGAVSHANESAYLSQILEATISEKVCQITYLKEEVSQSYCLQFFNISSAYGQWYVTGYDFERKGFRVCRCDKILSLEVKDAYPAQTLQSLIKSKEKMYKKPGAVDFKVEISKKGKDLYHKEHYPSMRLVEEDQRYFIQGFYNIGEERFIVHYFLAYGNSILGIEPVALKIKLLEGLEELAMHLQKI